MNTHSNVAQLGFQGRVLGRRSVRQGCGPDTPSIHRGVHRHTPTSLHRAHIPGPRCPAWVPLGFPPFPSPPEVPNRLPPLPPSCPSCLLRGGKGRKPDPAGCPSAAPWYPGGDFGHPFPLQCLQQCAQGSIEMAPNGLLCVTGLPQPGRCSCGQSTSEGIEPRPPPGHPPKPGPRLVPEECFAPA